MLNIKDQFPFFLNHPEITYLDSATTTQKPQVVLETLADYYLKYNTSVSRSSYPMANKLLKEIEQVREKIKMFINAKEKEEIIFNFGSTDGFNKIAFSLGFNYLKDGDEVLYCPLDHQSFILPWFQVQKLLKKMSINIHLIPFKVNKLGSIDRNDLFSKITKKTKIINATHVHSVFGADSDINKIREWLGNNDKNVIINVDATQSVGHLPVDVQKLGADILTFAGHKMFAVQGVGITFITKRLHQLIEPVFVGGGKGWELFNTEIKMVNFPQAYESGTQNYAGILTLGKAVEFIKKIKIENIHLHLSQLTQYLLQELRKLTQIEFTYGPNFWSCADGLGILSFKMNGIPASEIGFLLAENGILVRTGNHCISNQNQFDDIIRVSMHVYNTIEDVDRLIKILKKILS